MRILISAVLAVIAGAGSVAQAQAGGTYMWCMAWTEDATAPTYFYSGFFAAGSWETDRKKLAFKNKVERDDSGGAKVKTTCFEPVEYDKAVATRNAAMKAGPGKVLSWEG